MHRKQKVINYNFNNSRLSPNETFKELICRKYKNTSVKQKLAAMSNKITIFIILLFNE